MVSIDVAVDIDCTVGEGPLWHTGENVFYWADIARGDVFTYDPATGEHERVHEGDPFGGFTIQDDGSLLLFGEEGRIAELSDGTARTVLDGIPSMSGARFNDVVADPSGRVFAGCVDDAEESEGCLYRVDRDGSYERVFEDVRFPNGLGFSPDRSRLYLTDTEITDDVAPGRIYEFDYRRTSGGIRNAREFVETDREPGRPDGLTVDAEGYLWVAFWDGSQLVRYAPTGEVDRRIEFPMQKVSSVAFGGSEFTDLFVTTACIDDRAKEGDKAGSALLLDPQTQGKAEFRSRIRT